MDVLLYHGDTRPPEEIARAGGFAPRAPGSSTSLEDYATGNVPSNYVGATPIANVAERFAGQKGYVYGVTTRGRETVSVNDVLGTEWEFAWQQEIVFPGGIPLENILFSYPAPIWGP